MKEYKYNLGPIYSIIAGGILGLVLGYFILVYLARETSSLGFILIPVILYFCYRLFLAAVTICSVRLDSDEIHMKYFLALRKERIIRFDNIEEYAPIRRSRRKGSKPFAVILKPENDKGFILYSAGIKDFAQLHESLSQKLPMTNNEKM